MTDPLRELDAKFAEVVVGLQTRNINTGPQELGEHFWYSIPRYSRSLDAAWVGIGDRRYMTVELELIRSVGDEHGESWRCSFDDENDHYATHPAEALVRALIQAKEAEND